MSDLNLGSEITEKHLNYDEIRGLEEISEVNIIMGDIYIIKNDSDKAISYYKEAIKICTMIIDSYPKKNELFSKKIRDKLVFLNNKINELRDKILGAYFEQGCFCMKNKNWDKAVISFTNVLQYKSRDFLIYHNLALCFREIGDVDLAIDYLKKSIILNKNYLDSYKELGDIYSLIKKDEIKAKDCYEKYTFLKNSLIQENKIINLD